MLSDELCISSVTGIFGTDFASRQFNIVVNIMYVISKAETGGFVLSDVPSCVQNENNFRREFEVAWPPKNEIQ